MFGRLKKGQSFAVTKVGLIPKEVHVQELCNGLAPMRDESERARGGMGFAKERT